jgi:glycosyltransferase involved in cell wall biosynthesis
VNRSDTEPVDRLLPVTSLYGRAAPLYRRARVEHEARAIVDDAVDRTQPEVALVFNAAGLPTSAIRRLAERHVRVLFVVGDDWTTRVGDADPWVAPFRGGRARRLLGRLAGQLTGVPTELPRWNRLGRWLFVSAALQQRVVEATGEQFGDALVVPHGVDTADFPIDRGPDVVRPTWSWRLMFVGRLDPTKGIDTLVRALARAPAHATLDVSAPDETVHVDRVRRLAAEVGVADRVRITSVPRADLAAKYRAADVCVFPSEWEEPFGIVPLEAMACSTPVVASGTGGSGEYLRDGENCVIAAPGDPDALVAALERLSTDMALRDRIVAGGRGTARSLTIDALADRLEALALEAAAGPAARP